ncbi:hypothetical protein K474DRAFT_1658495 [Panus rudis PR-1116 ss-1]|nr:hypothetical protein K474DRAFT_1658495 [Panus rudis PR-1116 ss-1]
MGPKDSYICLIPPPPEDTAPSEDPEPSTDVTPVHTWSLLQPLTGTCLYVRTTSATSHRRVLSNGHVL